LGIGRSRHSTASLLALTSLVVLGRWAHSRKARKGSRQIAPAAFLESLRGYLMRLYYTLADYPHAMVEIECANRPSRGPLLQAIAQLNVADPVGAGYAESLARPGRVLSKHPTCSTHVLRLR
jgi:hypothetical protein